MGTNYYLVTEEHPKIKREAINEDINDLQGIHIGKSSGGWCFALHVYPEHGIKNMEDWQKLMGHSEAKIYSEYGDLVDHKYAFCHSTIDNRYWRHSPRQSVLGYVYTDEEYQKWLDLNYAVEGPNNLLRARIDKTHCIGHGEGTYDYIVGEFS